MKTAQKTDVTVRCIYPVNGNDIWYTDIVISELLYERSHFNHGIY